MEKINSTLHILATLPATIQGFSYKTNVVEWENCQFILFYFLLFMSENS